MPLLGGIDEVGYGARLGPLVLVGVCFEVPRLPVDLWKELSGAVCRRADGRRLPVCDSKVLFTQRRGIGALEPTALGFLRLRHGAAALSELSESLAGGCTQEVPWFQDADLNLSGGEPPEPLRRALKGARVRLAAVRGRVFDAPEFNARMARIGNKNAMHFEAVAELIEGLLEECPEGDVALEVGKLSGRNFYLRHLQQRFGALVLAESESRGLSRYRLVERNRPVSVSFVRDGDSSCFAVALASIIAKYVREGWMKLFNRYWASRVGKLKPTAGYGPDAGRFFEQIRHRLEGVAPRDVLRIK
jgi:ribonuclease HII